MHKITHQILNNTIPEDISVGYLCGNADETIIQPSAYLTTPRPSKPTASVHPIQPTVQSQPDSRVTEEENTNQQPQPHSIEIMTVPDSQPLPPPQNPIEVITISDDDSLEKNLQESHSSLTNLTGILAKRKRKNFWLKIKGIFN